MVSTMERYNERSSTTTSNLHDGPSKPNSHHLPPFLRMPLELRYHVFSYLCDKRPKYCPFSDLVISSISHRGPPLQLLQTCRQLCEEACAYYFGLATIRFLSLGVNLHSKTEISEGAMHAIRRAQNIELLLIWNTYSNGLIAKRDGHPRWMVEWLEVCVDLLVKEAPNLATVGISLRDASAQQRWNTRKSILDPLKLLRPKVTFTLDNVFVPDCFMDEVKSGLGEYITELNQ